MTALVSKQQILDAGTNGGFAQERGCHLRGTAPGHDDDGDGGYAAGAGAEGAADQRRGLGNEWNILV